MYSSRVPQKVDSQEGELDLEFLLVNADAYSEPSLMEPFTIFILCFIIDVWQGFEYISAIYNNS